MTNISDLRPMSMGEVLDRSFQVLRRHLGTLFLTALVGILPLLGIYLSAIPYSSTSAGASGAAAALFGFFYLLMFLTTAVAWGALTRDVDQAVHGRSVGFKEGLVRGFKAFFRIVAYWIMAYLAAVALLFPALFVAGIAMVAAGGALGGSVLAIFLAGGVVVVVAGAALLVWAPIGFLGLPVLIVEGLGPIRAVRRAHALGKGGRIRVAATAFTAWVIMMLPTIGLSFMLGLGLALFDPTAAGTSTSTQLYFYQVFSFLITGVTTPFMVAAMVFTYYDRRVRREGYDVELASESLSQTTA
jgi:hypothetical protein